MRGLIVEEVYKCKEESVADTGVEEPRVVVVSDTFLLMFEPEEKQSTAGDYCVLQLCLSLSQVLTFQHNLKSPSIVRFRFAQRDAEVRLVANIVGSRWTSSCGSTSTRPSLPIC